MLELAPIRTALTVALLITFVIALIVLAANGTSTVDTGLAQHQITGSLQATPVVIAKPTVVGVVGTAAASPPRPFSAKATVP